MTEKLELTDQEAVVVRNFVTALGDFGIRSQLTLRVADTYGGDEMTTRALDRAIEDLRSACGCGGTPHSVVAVPQGVGVAAPSFALVVRFAKTTPEGSPFRFPGDFLPGDDLVQRCLAWFYDEVRERAAPKSRRG